VLQLGLAERRRERDPRRWRRRPARVTSERAKPIFAAALLVRVEVGQERAIDGRLPRDLAVAPTDAGGCWSAMVGL